MNVAISLKMYTNVIVFTKSSRKVPDINKRVCIFPLVFALSCTKLIEGDITNNSLEIMGKNRVLAAFQGISTRWGSQVRVL